MTSTVLVPADVDWDRIVADISRREFFLGGAALVTLAACGDDPAGGPSSTSSPAAATRQVTHEFGTYEIPIAPQRVVVLDGRPSFEHALTLGFTPVAVGQDAVVDGQLAPFIEFDIEGIPLVNPNDVNFEALAAVSPDLIIARDFNIESQLDQLVEIAPILPVTWNDPWRVQLDRLAGWLQRHEAITGPLGRYDANVGEVRARHQQTISATQVGFVAWGVADPGVFSSMHDPAMMYHQTLVDLGGVEDGFLVSQPTYDAPPISIESIDALADVDALIANLVTAEDREAFETDPLWQSVPAVQRGNVVYTDLRANFGGVFAAMACLDVFDRLYATFA